MAAISAHAGRGRPRPAALLLLATLVVVLTACAEGADPAQDGSGADDGTATAGSSPDAGGNATASTPRPAADSELLAFTAPTVDGGQLDGGELAGEPVALWFWAPW